MLTDQYHVAHTGFFSGGNPLLSINLCGLIAIGRLRAVGPFHIVEGVDAKVDKHTVFAVDLCLLSFARCGSGLGQDEFLLDLCRYGGSQGQSQTHEEGSMVYLIIGFMELTFILHGEVFISLRTKIVQSECRTK